MYTYSANRNISKFHRIIQMLTENISGKKIGGGKTNPKQLAAKRKLALLEILAEARLEAR